jgi:hypothetical protein
MIPDEAATRVKPEDLQHLQVLHSMLRVLNDTLAGAPEIAQHVERFPTLKARVIRQFAKGSKKRPLPPLAQQIAALGNRQFEEMLFTLLEDLTMLQAELDPGK